jgi:hypothetical protein
MTPAALLYHDGQWTELPDDPIAAAFVRDGCAVPELITRLRYTPFTAISHEGVAPLGVTVYRGLAPPHWILLLESPGPDGNEERTQWAYVFAARLPDVMDLLGQWSAVIHNMTSAELTASQWADDLDADASTDVSH